MNARAARDAAKGPKEPEGMMGLPTNTDLRDATRNRTYDAVVVGAGPNGLSAAIVLAQAGRSVLVVEAGETVGGGARSAELTLPGFVHDVCSSIHPLAIGSPFFQTLPLDKHGLQWIHPPAPVAHPMDDGTAVILHRSVEATSQQFGPDAGAYYRLMHPLAEHWDQLQPDLMGPLRWPRHPVLLGRFARFAIRSAAGLARSLFQRERARALFAGLAAHAILPLDKSPSAAFGLVLGAAGHAVGWPMPAGGAQRISDALAGYLRLLGGEIVTGVTVGDINQLPKSKAVLLDLTPRQVCRLEGTGLQTRCRRRLENFRHGPGVFKIDWALDGPVPWTAPGCGDAGTVHLGGTLEEIAAGERDVWRRMINERPFVLLAQHSRFDPTRAPDGKHTAWAYCHVPHGSRADMIAKIELQVERFAPGFRDRILARHFMSPADLERYNANYIGGDINGGVADWGQLFFRPTARFSPYQTSNPRLFLCSSSTPPGGGVHGMCGYHAAMAALRTVLQ